MPSVCSCFPIFWRCEKNFFIRDHKLLSSVVMPIRSKNFVSVSFILFRT